MAAGSPGVPDPGRTAPAARLRRPARRRARRGTGRRDAVAVTLGESGALLSYAAGSGDAPLVVPAPASTASTPAAPATGSPSPPQRASARARVTSEAVQDGGRRTPPAYVAAGGPASLRRADGGHAPGGPRPSRTLVAQVGVARRHRRRHRRLLRPPARRPRRAPCARPGGSGDCLVVCLNSDASVRRLKGPTRPAGARRPTGPGARGAGVRRRGRGLRRGHPRRGAPPAAARHLGQGRRLRRRRRAGGRRAARPGAARPSCCPTSQGRSTTRLVAPRHRARRPHHASDRPTQR